MQNLLFRISKRKPLFLRLLLAASLISVFVIVITWDELPYLSTDAHFYIELAEGQPQNVPKPFSTRVFHPIMVQALTRIGGLSIDQSFLAWGIFSLIILCLSVSLVIQSANVPNHLLVTVVVLVTPLLLSLFRDYYLPDLFYAALLGLFFLLIIERSKLPGKYNGLSLFVLFLLYVTRESTILLTLSIVLISVYKPSERKFALAVIGVTLIGVFVSSLAGRLGQTNIHAMSDLLYIGLKIPFNFLKNILGMQLWTNTFAAQLGGACKPFVTINLPAWLLIGSIRSVGVCSPDITYPLSTITSLLTTFGIAPTILIYSLRMNFRRILENGPFWLIVALTYGTISFFVGTSVGASVDRLIGYGWPSFWIATPVISLQYCLNNQKPLHKLLLFHVLACWIPWLVFSLYIKSPQSIIFVLSIALMMHYLTFRAMRQSKDRT